jgi:hypothetical protein
MNKTEIELLTRNVQWIKLAEANDEVGYRGYLSTGQILEVAIIRVYKKHLKEIPVSIEEGDEVYAHGSHYPIALMDFIRFDGEPPVNAKLNTITIKSPQLQNDIPGTSDNITEDENTLKLTPNEKKVMEYIAQNPDSHHKDIADGLGMDKSNLYKLLK